MVSNPFPKMQTYLRQIYDAFGPQRMFYGTDLTRLTYWSVNGSRRQSSYRESVDLFAEALPWLSQADKEQILGLAVCNWIGWKV